MKSLELLLKHQQVLDKEKYSGFNSAKLQSAFNNFQNNTCQ